MEPSRHGWLSARRAHLCTCDPHGVAHVVVDVNIRHRREHCARAGRQRLVYRRLLARTQPRLPPPPRAQRHTRPSRQARPPRRQQAGPEPSSPPVPAQGRGRCDGPPSRHSARRTSHPPRAGRPQPAAADEEWRARVGAVPAAPGGLAVPACACGVQAQVLKPDYGVCAARRRCICLLRMFIRERQPTHCRRTPGTMSVAPLYPSTRCSPRCAVSASEMLCWLLMAAQSSWR